MSKPELFEYHVIDSTENGHRILAHTYDVTDGYARFDSVARAGDIDVGLVASFFQPVSVVRLGVYKNAINNGDYVDEILSADPKSTIRVNK